MNDAQSQLVTIYTDGACLANPGPGGYAAVMMRGTARRVIRGRDPETTNNRMELMAPIMALESMKTDAPVTIISDSEYVVKGMTEWIARWKAKGWKNGKRKDVANRDLWERLDTLASKRAITWQWTRGHADDVHNQEADRIASEEARKAQQKSVAA